MNVFGIGGLELLVILLVAFVALGPGKTVEVARTIGRMVSEARRTFNDIMDAASVSDNDVAGRRDQPNPSRDSGPTSQPPADPLPMPPHLREPAERTPAATEESDSEPPAVPR